MNRHNKFYAELSDLMDEDDDYYDEEEEEGAYEDGDDYYGEEGGEVYDDETGDADDDGYGPAIPIHGAVDGRSTTNSNSNNNSNNNNNKKAEAVSIKNTHITINPKTDEDFDLLDQLLPVLHETWKTSAPTQLPLTEGEAVRALRECEYDPQSCVPILVNRRRAEKEKSGGGAKVLKVVSVKKPDAKGEEGAAAKVRSDSEADEDGITGTATARTSTATRSSKDKKRQKDRYVDVQPDLSKPDCTFVVAGHVDAGKSTTLGHLLLLLGRVDVAEVAKNEKQGKSSHKESFKYAWLLDQSEEERRRGVTIDAGAYCFETAHRRIHILDAPGHKDFVINMISSATQADAAMLVVTAAPSEFEAGLQHGTKDHLMILKTLGVGCIIVVVNKMDAAGYAKERYDYVVQEMKLLAKQLRLKDNVVSGYVPVSGMEGTNMLKVDHERTPWYEGAPLLELLDNCSLNSRLIDAPLRLSLQDLQGNTLYARVESGRVSRGMSVRFVPRDVVVEVKSIDKPTVSGQVNVAFAGDTIEINTASSLVGLSPGAVGVPTGDVYQPSTDFEAHIQTFPSLSKSILPGATFTLCVHALTVPVKAVMLVSKMDNKGNWSKGMVKCVPPNAQALVVFHAETAIAVMPAEDCQALGRFVLQQDGETVAGGLVKKIMGTR